MTEMKLSIIHLIVMSAVFLRTEEAKHATITVIPNATVALINDSTFFNCSSTSGAAEWLFAPKHYDDSIIYSYGAVKEHYQSRFRVENYSMIIGSQFNLILLSVREDDAGRYICQNPRNTSEDLVGREAHLTVLVTEPVCKSDLKVNRLIGPNSCVIHVYPHVSCSVRYIGNQVPELQWKKNGENIAISSSICSDSGNVYTCNLTMKSELQLEEYSYSCVTTHSRTRKYSCTSGVSRTLYVSGDHTELNKTVNDIANCSVNSSQDCTSSWNFDNGTANWTESHEQVIKFERPGRFFCEATCESRNTTCSLTLMTVKVNTAPQDDNSLSVGAVIGIVVGVVIIMILLGPLIFFLLRKRRQNKQNGGNDRPLMRRVNAHIEEVSTLTPKSSQNRKGKRRVRGMAILNEKLFVTYESSNFVEIFRIVGKAANASPPYFSVNDLRDPGTIAACGKNDFLYIMDKRKGTTRKRIFRIAPDGTKRHFWETDDDDNGRISVNADGNVVMNVYDKHKLKMYSPDGKLLPENTIDLSGVPIEYIFHAINLADKNFAISQGIYKSDDHRVCKINTAGSVLQSFGSNLRGSGNALLNCPAYLIERKDGTILVADQENHRIVLLSSELKFIEELFTKENSGINLPDVMCVDERTQPPLLYVGCNQSANSGGFVLVLPLKVNHDIE